MGSGLRAGDVGEWGSAAGGAVVWTRRGGLGGCLEGSGPRVGSGLWWLRGLQGCGQGIDGVGESCGRADWAVGFGEWMRQAGAEEAEVAVASGGGWSNGAGRHGAWGRWRRTRSEAVVESWERWFACKVVWGCGSEGRENRGLRSMGSFANKKTKQRMCKEGWRGACCCSLKEKYVEEEGRGQSHVPVSRFLKPKQS
jgi:hypothetical protein